MDNSNLVQCYNKGCGKKFDPFNNTEDVCVHHPGQPVFHDAYKTWSCCNKRSTDFTTFLNMPGCVIAPHNPNKPPEPVKYVPPPDFVPPAEKPAQPRLRPPLDSPLVPLQLNVTKSLEQLLAKAAEESLANNTTDVDSSTGTKIGQSCHHNGCSAKFEGPGSNLELCKYHPGGPIFHEGMKYWSCCQKKTSDFTEFLAQSGCTTGAHVWTDEKVKSQNNQCRFDWHQTGSYVIVTIYAKASIPSSSSVIASPVRLVASIIYAEHLEFNLDLELAGVVEPSSSSVTLAATKVEIKLKKACNSTWSKLFVEKKSLSEAKTRPAEEEIDENEIASDLALDVDAVDLSDL